ALAGPLLRGLGGHGRSGHFALVYMRIGALGLPAALVALAGQGYLRGVSNLRRPLVIVVVANAANVVLEVLFVYGFHWGIAGWATRSSARTRSRISSSSSSRWSSTPLRSPDR